MPPFHRTILGVVLTALLIWGFAVSALAQPPATFNDNLAWHQDPASLATVDFFECRMDGGAPINCGRMPLGTQDFLVPLTTFPSLTTGPHLAEVRACDNVPNPLVGCSQWSAPHSFDFLAPTAPPPPAPDNVRIEPGA